MNRIGNRMVSTGLIEPGQLEVALERQREQGGYLGQHLVDAGFVTRQQLYDGLAEQWQVPRRDLDRQPPRAGLLGEHDLRRVIELGWVPCEVSAAAGVVVATSVPPVPDLVEEVGEYFPGLAVTFVACTRRDLDRLALTIEPARDAVAPPRTRRGFCASPAVRDLAVGALVVVSLGWLLAVPPAVLAGLDAALGTAFLGLVVVHVAVTTWTAVRGAGAAAVIASSTALPLPVYTVLVPVSGGARVLRSVVRDLASLDYPQPRLDAVLLVARDDEETLSAVRTEAPPSFVRVAAIDPVAHADPGSALDVGLSLARGRYVVGLLPGELPDPEQLRMAVGMFERDLHENLETRTGRAPLAALRVARRQWGWPGSFGSGLEVVEEVSGFTRVYPWQGPGTDLRADLTTTHCNTSLLRRMGGWHALRTGGTSTAVRVAVLPSVTRCRRTPSLGRLLARRADEVARELSLAARRARRFRLVGARTGPRLGEVLLAFAAPALLLVYPVALVASAALVLRDGELDAGGERLGHLGLAAVAGAMGLAILACLVTARWRGQRATGHVLMLPAYWLVRAVAAWYAVLVLLPCRPPSHGSSTYPPPA